MTATHAGELAALGTAACWTVTSISFELAGRRIGSLSVNLIRLVFAMGLLAVAGSLARGKPLPTDADTHAWLWLTVSGLFGFTFGDMCLFRAFVVLGARLSSLIMSLVPPLTAVIGWLILGETAGARDALGIGLTVAGVALAVSERTAPAPHLEPGRNLGKGIALAFGGALGQAGGLVLSKLGMGQYHPMAATQIRIIAGIIGFAAVFSIIGWWPRVRAACRDRRGLSFTALGALFGPAVGVTLSLYAVQHANAGVAASIMATTPVLIIPVVMIVHKERVGPRGILGALAACTGVTLLFL